VFDPVNDRAIVFGGRDLLTSQLLNETWQMLHGNPAFATWTRIAGGGPFAMAPPTSGTEASSTELALEPRATSDGSVLLAVTVPKPGNVSLEIFDVSGRLVRRFDEQFAIAGQHDIVWDGRDAQSRLVSNGMFFARLQAAGAFARAKVVLNR